MNPLVESAKFLLMAKARSGNVSTRQEFLADLRDRHPGATHQQLDEAVNALKHPAWAEDGPRQSEEKNTAVAVAEPVSVSESTEPTEEPEVADEEIVAVAQRLVTLRKPRPEIRAALLKEFNGIEDDVNNLIDRAYEKEVETAQAEEDYAKKVARDAVDEADRHLVEKHQLAGTLGKDIDPNDTKRAAAVLRGREWDEAEKEAKEEAFDDETGEPYPECPVFSGALTDLARAVCPSLPLEFKQWGLITRWGLMRSGLDSLEFESHLQPRFYTVLVAFPNRGKTAAINESRSAMEKIAKAAKDKFAQASNLTPTPCVFSGVENVGSADSGPFLVQKFFDKAKEISKEYLASSCADDRAKILLDADELADVFQKARTSNNRVSTLFTEFLKLHSGNRTANGTKQTGDRPVNNAHLAILAGATSKNYPTLWTGTGSGGDGLMSRFLIITTNAKQVPAVPLSSDFLEIKNHSDRLTRLAQLPGQTIRLSQEAGTILTDWWASIDSGKPSATRILEAVKQLLIVLAVTNAPDDHTGATLTVGVDLTEQAIQFGNYEIAVREMLNPSDSWSAIQAMENAVMEWFKKHADRKNPKSRNDCRRGVQPQRRPGGLGTFLIAWGNCVTSDVLKLRDKTQRAARYSL